MVCGFDRLHYSNNNDILTIACYYLLLTLICDLLTFDTHQSNLPVNECQYMYVHHEVYFTPLHTDTRTHRHTHTQGLSDTTVFAIYYDTKKLSILQYLHT